MSAKRLSKAAEPQPGIARPRLWLAYRSDAENENQRAALPFIERSISLGNSRRYRQAMVAANRAVKLAPDYPRAHAARALASHGIGDVDGALAACKRAIELKADYPEAYCVRGVVLSEAAGRHEEALADLGHALQLKPDYYQVLQVRGDVFVAMGRYEEAIAEFTRALEIMPIFQDAWTSRGSLFVKLGRYRDASQDFDFLIYLKAFSAAAEGYAELSEALFKEFGESKTPGYTREHGETMGDEANTEDELVKLARKVPSEKRDTAFDLLINLIEGARETTGRATAEPRPEKAAAKVTELVKPASPAAVEWPTEKWNDSDEKAFNRNHAVVKFLTSVWKPFIEETSALVTIPVIEEHDRDLGTALRGYINRHPKTNVLKEIGIFRPEDIKKSGTSGRPLLTMQR